MKKIITLTGIFIAIGLTRVAAQSEAEMKAWQEYMTPGEVHKMLAKYAGNWTDEISMWMAPGAEPTKTTTTSKTEMILGGRYQLSKTTGTMMGMPFEGMAIMGYDNAKKVFTTTWVDNFGTGTLTMAGTWDAASKSITLTGKMIDPMTGKEVLTKQVITLIDDNTQQMEMYDNKTGTETKSMQMISKRSS